MSAFGSRQTLYERFFFSDPIKLQSNLFKSYERNKYTQNVKDFLSKKDE
jgi:4-hydroxyphenylacetate 3-monooxygenase